MPQSKPTSSGLTKPIASQHTPPVLAPDGIMSRICSGPMQAKDQSPSGSATPGRQAGITAAYHKQTTVGTPHHTSSVLNQAQPSGNAAPGKEAAVPASSTSRPPRNHASDSTPICRADSKGKMPTNEDNDILLIRISLFYFRGEPDAYSRRHVVAYFTSEDDLNFNWTVHAQRETEATPWIPKLEFGEVDWPLTRNYLGHVDAGAVQVVRGQEMEPFEMVASTDVTDREGQSDWNCQNFLLEGLLKLAESPFGTIGWYAKVEDDLLTALLDGAVP